MALITSAIVRHCARDVSIHDGTRNPGATFYDYMLGFENHFFDIIGHFTNYSQMRSNQFLAYFINYPEGDFLHVIDIANLQGASLYLHLDLHALSLELCALRLCCTWFAFRLHEVCHHALTV